MQTYDESLPETIKAGPMATMSFLRNAPYLTRVFIQGNGAIEEFFIAPHWHETHDELFHVRQGRLEVLMGTEKRFYTSDDGEICIPKGVVHSLRVVLGEECIFEERTEPMDDEKELFFRNLWASGELVSGFFDSMLLMYRGDMRPVLPGHMQWLERAVVIVIGGVIAPMLGYKLPVASLRNVRL